MRRQRPFFWRCPKNFEWRNYASSTFANETQLFSNWTCYSKYCMLSWTTNPIQQSPWRRPSGSAVATVQGLKSMAVHATGANRWKPSNPSLPPSKTLKITLPPSKTVNLLCALYLSFPLYDARPFHWLPLEGYWCLWADTMMHCYNRIELMRNVALSSSSQRRRKSESLWQENKRLSGAAGSGIQL